MEMLISVKETPWGHLGTRYKDQPKTLEDIITQSSYNWPVAYQKMYTDLHESVFGYNAIYRTDTNEVLGVVNNRYPKPVQNVDMFNFLEELNATGKIDFECVSELEHGRRIFGIFKFSESYQVFDDDIDHYFVVVNDHTKSDGKVSLIHTPVRIVCCNMLTGVLPKNFSRVRIPIPRETYQVKEITDDILVAIQKSQQKLTSDLEAMRNAKLERSQVEAALDVLFPLIKNKDGEILDINSNISAEMHREQFISECMGADDLQNYRGTVLHMYHALTDFSQHYYTKFDKTYELDYRIKRVPGIAAEPSLVDKFMPLAKQFIRESKAA